MMSGNRHNLMKIITEVHILKSSSINRSKRILAVCCTLAVIASGMCANPDVFEKGVLLSPAVTVCSAVSANPQNEAEVFRFLTEKMNLNTAAACGVMGNIYAESRFSCTSVGDGGTSYGLCQWHDGRWTNLKNFCASNGLDVNSVYGQCSFLKHELESGYPALVKLMQSVSNTPDGAVLVADEWCRKYERPDKVDATSLQRQRNSVELFWIEYASPAADSVLGINAPRPSTYLQLTTDSSGAYVKWLQTALNRISGAGLTVDGAFGSKTEQALINLQKTNNISANGKCGRRTVSLIVKLISGKGSIVSDYDGDIPYIPPMSEQSKSSYTLEGTKWIQASLNKLCGSNLVVDGLFGSGTHSALVSFQTANGLTANGVCDSTTINKIKSLLTGTTIITEPDPVIPHFSPSDEIIGFTEPTENQSKTSYTTEGTKWLQSALSIIGNYKLTIDGIFGDATYKALVDFQSTCKLAADGICGKDTRKKIVAIVLGEESFGTPVEGIPYAEPTKNQSMSSFDAEGTKWVQYTLNQICGTDINVDGIFGQKTKDVVIAYQHSKGLAPDGIVGVDTRKHIKTDLGISVDPVISYIKITSLPTVTSYNIGDSFSSAGLTLTAVYSNDSQVALTDGFTCSTPDMSAAGDKTVTVTYRDFSTSFIINVKSVGIESVSIASLPSKLSYYRDEAFDPTGFRMKVSYTDGTSEIVSDYTNISFDSSVVGYQYVRVGYQGFFVDFTVYIAEIQLRSLSVSTLPAKTEYIVGEELDTTGLSLLAVYSNGERKVVTEGFECSCSVDESGIRIVQVKYGTMSTSYKISVTGEKPLISWELATGNCLRAEWSAVENADEYYVFVNGRLKSVRKGCFYTIDAAADSEYTITVAAYRDGKQLSISDNVLMSAVGEIILGDVNGDGIVDSQDIITLQCYLADSYCVEINLANSDIDGDLAITMKDVSLISQHIPEDTE